MIPLLLALSTAMAPVQSPQTACRPYVVSLAGAARTTEAARITHLSGHHTDPGEVHLALARDGWRLVWAAPDDSEEGVWFLKRAGSGFRHVDTWGGVTSSDAERTQTVRWARRLGVPLPLARCFAVIELNYEVMR